MHAKRIDISIIIATYNRAALLKETLESLLDVEHSGLAYEIIVVDNNSNDNTAEVVNKYSEKNSNIKLVKEIRQGLSFARNKGIDVSKGDILIFLDDDVEVAEGWLKAIIEPFKEPDVWCVGGRVVPHGDINIPDWLPLELRFLVGILDYGTHEKILVGREKPAGGNLAVRRIAFDMLGKFDTNIGRQGEKLLGGEEVDLYYNILKSKKKIVYCPKALAYHKIKNKLNREYILSYAYWLGVSEAYIEKKYFKTKFYIKLARSLFYSIIVHPFMFLFNCLNNIPESDKFRTQYLVRYSMGYLKRRK